MLKIKGGTSRKMGKIELFQCPYCDYHFEQYSSRADGTFECYNCKKTLSRDKLKIVSQTKPIVICSECKKEVSLTQGNLDLDNIFYDCAWCGNTVAIRFNNQHLQPSTVLTLSWNNLKKRAIEVNNRLSFVICKTKKDFLILRLMQSMVKSEQGCYHFNLFRKEAQKAGLIFNSNAYLGYLIWTEKKEACLRQIYVVEAERKNGYCTTLLKFWVETFANRLNEVFMVESPNTKFERILVRLGYTEPKCVIIRPG